MFELSTSSICKKEYKNPKILSRLFFDLWEFFKFCYCRSIYDLQKASICNITPSTFYLRHLILRRCQFPGQGVTFRTKRVENFTWNVKKRHFRCREFSSLEKLHKVLLQFKLAVIVRCFKKLINVK